MVAKAKATIRDNMTYGSEDVGTFPPLGHVVLTKVVREHVPVPGGGQGTFGSFIDHLLGQSLEKGEEVQTIALNIDEEVWNDMRGVHNHNKSREGGY